MLTAKYQYFIYKIKARRFELSSMLRIRNLQIKNMVFRAFIAPKADRIHNIEFLTGQQ